uniref:NADH-ubiquinone oxidoreductase chain 3 n=1 Tax=Ptiliidae sp. BMNH 1274724 TaxID=1796537 RepID=A0A126TGI2_9COLE|nr:NADH dehydrogenase subunit 3 [Ptiliidae sp. BMNH 1274724]
MYLSIIIFMLSNIIMIMVTMISKKTFMDREKLSPFECGFDPKSSARLPFSLHFFIIAIIYLIFDLEITMIIPVIYIINISNMYNLFMYTTYFLMILLMGLIHEWNQGALNWSF